MTIDTDHLRRTARLMSSHSRNILTPAGVDAVLAACDHIDAQAAEIERDDPSLFFWMMPPAEIGGRCEYKIEDEHGNQD